MIHYIHCIWLSPRSCPQQRVTHCTGLCFAFPTDLKHLQKAMQHKCVIPAAGHSPGHRCLWVSQMLNNPQRCTAFELWWSFGFLVGWGYFTSSDSPQTQESCRGEKLNPTASCIQWVKWWSIHSGQDAAAPQFNPCSQAIRTAAIPQWSLLRAGCSWWYCSLGNDYLAIKANVCFISAFFGHKYWGDIVLHRS